MCKRAFVITIDSAKTLRDLKRAIYESIKKFDQTGFELKQINGIQIFEFLYEDQLYCNTYDKIHRSSPTTNLHWTQPNHAKICTLAG